MTKILPKQNMGILLAKEENLLNWNKVLEEFKTLNSLIYYGHGVHKG